MALDEVVITRAIMERFTQKFLECTSVDVAIDRESGVEGEG